ncbi:helix-turn-helix domain-containing protein [Melissospora conviva]|uniref:AraC family transcriptional regulator n=1 Tax=Melissospora conviva TaxID=3388432 RepID=UPI003C16D36A
MIACRGHLNPGDPDVRMERVPLGSRLGELARHVWIGRWDIPGGQTRRQQVLTYPGCNIAVMPQEAALHGPALRLSTRDLRGTSWVVGVLLQPAAARTLTRTPPRRLVDSCEPLPAGPWREIRELMTVGPYGEVVDVLEGWLLPYAALVDDTGRLVNAACHLAETDASVLTAAVLAQRLGVADRTLRRALAERTGVTAKWLIERRRLQHAAEVLRRHPSTSLARLAADLGYADQPHFTRRYRDIIGRPPGRARLGSPASARR